MGLGRCVCEQGSGSYGHLHFCSGGVLLAGFHRALGIGMAQFVSAGLGMSMDQMRELGWRIMTQQKLQPVTA